MDAIEQLNPRIARRNRQQGIGCVGLSRLGSLPGLMFKPDHQPAHLCLARLHLGEPLIV